MIQWQIPILAYHRVGEPKGDHVPTVTPEAFAYQLAFLQRHRYRVLALEEVVRCVSRGEPLPKRATVITFDDGYEETFSVARPLLHRFGFPATVFVAPMEVEQPGFMTWDQVRAVATNGMTVGSHTLHHAYLPLISREHLQQELGESKAILERQLGQPIQWLSYPVGGYNTEVQLAAKAAGYGAACTTNRGVSRTQLDLFALRRVKITERDRQPFSLWLKLSGYYDVFRRLEQPA